MGNPRGWCTNSGLQPRIPSIGKKREQTQHWEWHGDTVQNTGVKTCLPEVPLLPLPPFFNRVSCSPGWPFPFLPSSGIALLHHYTQKVLVNIRGASRGTRHINNVTSALPSQTLLETRATHSFNYIITKILPCTRSSARRWGQLPPAVVSQVNLRFDLTGSPLMLDRKQCLFILQSQQVSGQGAADLLSSESCH